MEKPKGHVCPECEAPWSTDNSPSCACGRRAADALRDTRTAEAAAAEDFDPLRIRPYVNIEGRTGGTEPDGAAPEGLERTETTEDGGAVGAATLRAPVAESTMPLRAIAPPATPPAAPPAAPPASTRAPRTPGPGASDPSPSGLNPSELSASDLSLFESGPARVEATARPGEGGYEGEDEGPGRSRRSRRAATLLGVSAAVVAVVAAAGYASGLFSYESPARDGAAPEARASIPDARSSVTASASSPPTAVPPPVSSPPTAPAGAAPPLGAGPSLSPSVSATADSASPSRPGAGFGQSPDPTPPAQTTTTAPAPTTAPPATTLRRGDQGPQVTELQQRLAQAHFYTGSADGFYDQHVESSVGAYQWYHHITADDRGVYGPATRASLESETSRP